ncbi:MAG: hypothetical protein C0407_09460 [Desulfobacca sp.]|nr:hypothetical protein [Desulfobacca sp.]
MKTYDRPVVKTTVFFEKQLLYEIDQDNPFSTRKEFLVQACQHYLKELKRKRIDHELSQACAEAEKEDLSVNQEWEPLTWEGWK